MNAGYMEQETSFVGWFKTWKQWGGSRDSAMEGHAPFMDTSFVWWYETLQYERRLASLMTQLLVTLDLWCGGSGMREKWFVANNMYWAREIDLEILSRHYQE